MVNIQEKYMEIIQSIKSLIVEIEDGLSNDDILERLEGIIEM